MPESVHHHHSSNNPSSSTGPLVEVRPLKDNEGTRTTLGTELASMDSTDTFASCATHPFPSQADLTTAEQGSHDRPHTSAAQRDSSNLYVNPLDDPRLPSTVSSANHPICPGSPTPRNSPRQRALRSQAYTTDSFDDTKSTDILLGGSRSSLQDSPLPKHRRARFQEVRDSTCILTTKTVLSKFLDKICSPKVVLRVPFSVSKHPHS